MRLKKKPGKKKAFRKEKLPRKNVLFISSRGKKEKASAPSQDEKPRVQKETQKILTDEVVLEAPMERRRRRRGRDEGEEGGGDDASPIRRLTGPRCGSTCSRLKVFLF